MYLFRQNHKVPTITAVCTVLFTAHTRDILSLDVTIAARRFHITRFTHTHCVCLSLKISKSHTGRLCGNQGCECVRTAVTYTAPLSSHCFNPQAYIILCSQNKEQRNFILRSALCLHTVHFFYVCHCVFCPQFFRFLVYNRTTVARSRQIFSAS